MTAVATVVPPHALTHEKRMRLGSADSPPKSLAEIADGLNADRIPTAQGGRRWYPSTIRSTLERVS